MGKAFGSFAWQLGWLRLESAGLQFSGSNHRAPSSINESTLFQAFTPPLLHPILRRETPLLLASRRGCPTIVEALLQVGVVLAEVTVCG